MTELLIGALPSEPVLLTPDRLASAELMLFKLEDKNITPKRKVNVWRCMPTRKPTRGAVSAHQVIAVKFLGPEACDYLIFHMWPVGNSVSSAGKKSRFWPHEIFPYFFSVAWSLLFFNMTRIHSHEFFVLYSLKLTNLNLDFYLVPQFTHPLPQWPWFQVTQPLGPLSLQLHFPLYLGASDSRIPKARGRWFPYVPGGRWRGTDGLEIVGDQLCKRPFVNMNITVIFNIGNFANRESVILLGKFKEVPHTSRWLKQWLTWMETHWMTTKAEQISRGRFSPVLQSCGAVGLSRGRQSSLLAALTESIHLEHL